MTTERVEVGEENAVETNIFLICGTLQMPAPKRKERKLKVENARQKLTGAEGS